MYEVTGVFREIRFPQPQSRGNTLVSRGTALWSKEMETLGSENRISTLHYCYKDPRGLLAGSPQDDRLPPPTPVGSPPRYRTSSIDQTSSVPEFKSMFS